MGGLDALLAETSSVREPFGNKQAGSGLVELLTLRTLPRTKGRGCLAGGEAGGARRRPPGCHDSAAFGWCGMERTERWGEPWGSTGCEDGVRLSAVLGGGELRERLKKKKKNRQEFFGGMEWGRGAARGERKEPLSTTKGKGEIMTLPPPPNNKADQMGGK